MSDDLIFMTLESAFKLRSIWGITRPGISMQVATWLRLSKLFPGCVHKT